MADAEAEDLRQLLEACDQMLDHYAANRPADDPAARVMRESRRQLQERLEVVERNAARRSRDDLSRVTI